ncbi:amine oxidase [Methylomonas sp. AM2-LC]|uniref:amine oxidase n=1 Tax=Methylomonas sp. AM2-LC TaxID=3153301 RepID=UPI0032666112
MTNSQQLNTHSLAKFSLTITAIKVTMKQQYIQRLSSDLSRQQWLGCFQRNVVSVIEHSYEQAMLELICLNFDTSHSQVSRGVSELTPEVLQIFDGFVDEFLLFVIDKHRTSCALSNFPDEHKPDRAYVNTVRREIAGLWQEFALNVNAYLLESRVDNRVKILL